MALPRRSRFTSSSVQPPNLTLPGLQEFYEKNPPVWFALLESHFFIRGITEQTQRYNIASKAVPERVVAQLRLPLQSHDVYNDFKKAVLAHFGWSSPFLRQQTSPAATAPGSSTATAETPRSVPSSASQEHTAASPDADTHLTAIHAHGAVDTTTKLNSFSELFRAVDDKTDVTRPSPYLQLQPFYAKNVEVWLAQAEAFFSVNGITSDVLKCKLVIRALPTDRLSFIRYKLLSAPSVQYSLLKQAILSPIGLPQHTSAPGPAISSSPGTLEALSTRNDVPADSPCLDRVIPVSQTCMPKCVSAPSSTATASEFMPSKLTPHGQTTKPGSVPVSQLGSQNKPSASLPFGCTPSTTPDTSPSVLSSASPAGAMITAPTGNHARDADHCDCADAPERVTSSTQERGLLCAAISNPSDRKSPQRTSSPSPVPPQQSEPAGGADLLEGKPYAQKSDATIVLVRMMARTALQPPIGHRQQLPPARGYNQQSQHKRRTKRHRLGHGGQTKALHSKRPKLAARVKVSRGPPRRVPRSESSYHWGSNRSATKQPRFLPLEPSEVLCDIPPNQKTLLSLRPRLALRPLTRPPLSTLGRPPEIMANHRTASTA